MPRLNGITYATVGHIKLLQSLQFEVTLITSKTEIFPDLTDYGIDGLTILQFDIYGSGLLWSPVKGQIDAIVDYIETFNPRYLFVEGWYNWGIHILLKTHGSYKKIVFSHGSAEIGFNDFLSFARRIGYLLYDNFYNRKLFNKLNGLILLTDYEDNNRFRDLKFARKYSISTFILPNLNNEMICASSLNYSERFTEGFRVAVIGEMSSNKNQSYVFKIINSLEKQIKFDFFFPNENLYSKNFNKKTSELFLKHRIFTHIGLNRKEINIYIKNNVDLLLILSRTEAQPIVLIDALHLGIPFLSTPVGCISNFNGGVYCGLNEIVMNLNKFATDSLFLNHQKLAALKFSKKLQVDINEFHIFLKSI